MVKLPVETVVPVHNQDIGKNGGGRAIFYRRRDSLWIMQECDLQIRLSSHSA